MADTDFHLWDADWGTMVPGLEGNSLVPRHELDALLTVVPAEGRFLELGTFMGVTAAVIADARPNLVIWSVDWQNTPALGRAGINGWQSNRRPNMRLLVAHTDDLDTLLPDHSFHGIFVDADHRYERVRHDLALAERLLRPGGVLLAHDYGHPWFDGPKRAVDEFCSHRPWRCECVIGTLVRLVANA